MKNLLFILLALAISIVEINAQDTTAWKLNSGKVLSGEGPLSSGIAGSLNLSKGKSTVVCDYNSTLGEMLYFYSPDSAGWLSFGFSGGVFKSQMWVPWAGPIASLSLFKGHLTSLHWFGWSLGNPEMEKMNSNVYFCFSYQQVSLNWKFAEAYYVLMHFQDNKPEHILGTKCTFGLGGKISLFGEGGYMFTAEKYLWSTGLIYYF